MASGTLKIKLRPLRLAFLIDPFDRKALLTSIETNSFLWGGAFNPILPVYRRLPTSLKPDLGKAPSARALLNGYIDAFDPDFIVKVGALEPADLKFEHHEVIKCSEILADVDSDGTPTFGIGFFELLQHFAETELKFVRRKSLKIRFPKIPTKNRLFLGSVFGVLSPKIEERLAHIYANEDIFEWCDCSISNYCELLLRDNLFIRRLGTLGIDPIQHWHHSGDCIFLLDENCPIDIIDYWNLRALGRDILPVPRGMVAEPAIKRLAADFVDENSFAYQGNPNIFNHTTILSSRSIPMAEIEEFGRSIRPLLKPSTHPNEWKVTYQSWFPRIWDEWARAKDCADPCQFDTLEEDYEFTDQDKTVSFKSLMPEFASRFGGHGKPRCANETALRIWSRDFLPAEVIPSGGVNVARAAGAYGYWDWRCAKTGLVCLPTHKNWHEYIEIRQGESVFAEWLRSRSWDPQISDKGHIAKQMFKQLGGEFGIAFLATEGLVELLGKFAQNRTMHENAFRGAVSEISNKQKFRLPTPERIVEWLIGSRVIQAGLEMQCPSCRQYSWHSLKESDYEIRCPKCLDQFAFPAERLKQIHWAYKAIGPFSLPQQAYGAYSVLLTLRFFMRQLDGAVTPMLSFVSKKGPSTIEADLGLIFQESKFRNTRTDSVFAECKTFNKFERRDADRMLLLANEFPGSVLVFATLRKSLTATEQHILQRVANRGRRYWKADLPYNPVLILTGNELLANQEPRYVWQELGGIHGKHAQTWGDRPKLAALADSTQQIYLGMKPWHQWLDEQWRARIGRRVMKARTSGEAASGS